MFIELSHSFYVIAFIYLQHLLLIMKINNQIHHTILVFILKQDFNNHSHTKLSSSEKNKDMFYSMILIKSLIE